MLSMHRHASIKNRISKQTTYRGVVRVSSKLEGAVPEMLGRRGLEHDAALPGHQEAAVPLHSGTHVADIGVQGGT